jgi:hypothetical protein
VGLFQNNLFIWLLFPAAEIAGERPRGKKMDKLFWNSTLVRLFELDPNGLVPLVNQVNKLTTTL